MTQSGQVVDISLAKVRRFCDRKDPPDLRYQLLWEVAARGGSITIYERRAPWPGAPDPESPWSKREIAQFRQGEANRMWTLRWADRNARWRRRARCQPSRRHRRAHPRHRRESRWRIRLSWLSSARGQAAFTISP